MANRPPASRLHRVARRMRIEYRKNKWLFFTYFVLRIAVVGVMIAQFFNQNYENMFFCLLTLFLFTIPSFIERRIKIDVPDTLEIIILLFIFAAEILGEIGEYYVHVPHWDTMMHTLNGFLCAAIGFSMIDILNRSAQFAFSLSPFFVALVAFCFSMTIGVLWEFFEFAMDSFFLTDMQKDTVVSTISSVLLHPEGRNIPVIVDIESVVINGEAWNYGGYVDIGLIDTMKDLIVNFIGAIVFSVIGYFYVKRRGSDRFIRHFVPTRIQEPGEDTDLPSGASHEAKAPFPEDD